MSFAEKMQERRLQETQKFFQQQKGMQTKQHLQKKMITNDPKKLQQQQKAIEKQQLFQRILIEKGIRIQNDYLTNQDFQPDSFMSKLLKQIMTNCYLIPTVQGDKDQIIKIISKACVYENYELQAKQRIYDLQQWFNRKINYGKQTKEEFHKRQALLLKNCKEFRKQLHSEGANEKFDNLEDTRQYKIEKQLQPTLIFVSQNAYRILTFENIFYNVQQFYTFFTRHWPIDVVIEMINNGLYSNCKFAFCTISRCLKLLQVGALDLSKLKHVIVDCGFLDDKNQTPFEYDEARANLQAFYKELKEKTQNEIKTWIL